MTADLEATCPECGKALYRNVSRYSWGGRDRFTGELRPPIHEQVDPTWRHADGSLACAEPEGVSAA